MFNFLALDPVWGYIIVVVSIIATCLLCWLIRKKFQIGTFTKEEESNMKSNLDLLLKEEDVDEDRDITDEV